MLIKHPYRQPLKSVPGLATRCFLINGDNSVSLISQLSLNDISSSSNIRNILIEIQTNFNYLSPLVSIQWWKSIFAHYSAQLNENELFFELAFKKIGTNLCKKFKPSSYYGFGNRTASLIFSAQLELNKLISENILENMLINQHNESQPSKSISFNYNGERAVSLIYQLSLMKISLSSNFHLKRLIKTCVKNLNSLGTIVFAK